MDSVLGCVVYRSSWRYTCSPEGCHGDQDCELLDVHRVHYEDFVSIILYSTSLLCDILMDY